MHLGRDFQAQAVQADEAGGDVLVVGPAVRDWVGFHRGVHGLIKTAAANPVRHAARARFQRRSLSGGKR